MGCLNTDGQRLITTIPMRPCPTELGNSGVCHRRKDLEHRKHYYHYSAYHKKDGIIYEDGKVYVKTRCMGISAGRSTTANILKCFAMS